MTTDRDLHAEIARDLILKLLIAEVSRLNPGVLANWLGGLHDVIDAMNIPEPDKAGIRAEFDQFFGD